MPPDPTYAALASHADERVTERDRDELGSVVAWLREGTPLVPDGCRKPWIGALDRILRQMDKDGVRRA